MRDGGAGRDRRAVLRTTRGAPDRLTRAERRAACLGSGVPPATESAMRPHPAALVLPLLAVLAAPALAADATTKVFKKAAKSRLKELDVAVKVALQPVKAELSGVASAYASGDLTGGDAV